MVRFYSMLFKPLVKANVKRVHTIKPLKKMLKMSKWWDRKNPTGGQSL